MKNINYNIGISLGHNASVAIIEDIGEGKVNVIDAIENERISRIKSDSSVNLALERSIKVLASDIINKFEKDSNVVFNINLAVSNWYTYLIDNQYINNDNIINIVNLIKNNNFNILDKQAFPNHIYPDILKNYKELLIKEIKKKNNKINENRILINEINWLLTGHHNIHLHYSHLFAKKYAENFDKSNILFIILDGFGNNFLPGGLGIKYSNLNDIFYIPFKIDIEEYFKTDNKTRYIENNLFYLALFYQYATSFVGMKENQDEYKFLGYERYIKEQIPIEVINLLNKEIIPNHCSLFLRNYNKILEKQIEKDLMFLDYRAYHCNDNNKIKELELNKYQEFLTEIKNYYYNCFNLDLQEIERKCNYQINTVDKKRIIIGYIIQNVVEEVLKNIINNCQSRFFREMPLDYIVVNGGLFYNVKLNNSLIQNIISNSKLNNNFINTKLIVPPLAGDVATSIGIAAIEANELTNIDTLFYGRRNIIDIIKQNNDFKLISDNFYKTISNNYGLIRMNIDFSNNNIISEIAESIYNGDIVNIIKDNLEFGPRALCNTSTLALPTELNSKIINLLNARNEVMPFAPVILEKNIKEVFNIEEINRCLGSYYYMIITFTYNDKFVSENYDKYAGVFCNIYNYRLFSGRPQVIKEDNKDTYFIYKLLDYLDKKYNVKMLINTSYNYHGVPINNTLSDGIIDYIKEIANMDKIVNITDKKIKVHLYTNLI